MNPPLLGRVVEADVGGAGDLEGAKQLEVDGLGVEALNDSPVSLEAEGGFHPSLPPNRCWFREAFDCRQ